MSRTIESPNTALEFESKTRVLEEYSTEFDLHHPETGETISVVFTPSVLTSRSPLSIKDTDIRLVPVSQLIRHEDFFKKGLEKVFLSENGFYRWYDAPMVGVENEDGRIMVIDGSTRFGRVQALSEHVIKNYDPRHTPVFPVQVIKYDHEDLVLGIWEKHHSQDKILEKQKVMEMALAGEIVEPKQTKFGVKMDGKLISIAQTQGIVEIHMNQLLGMNLKISNVSNDPELKHLLR